ncbi:glycosyltransferase [bacterium]|nr:glycosyltransferase [bacterium]
MLKEYFRYIFQYFRIKLSGLFDKGYYDQTYPDVRKLHINSLWHFLRFGWKEGKNPSENFDTKFYMDYYPDIKYAGTNPLIHYIDYGRKENRYPTKDAIGLEGPNKKIKIFSADSIRPIKSDKFRLNTDEIYNSAQEVSLSDQVDIVICVGSKVQNVYDCVDSIKTNTEYKNYCIHLVIHEIDIGKISTLLKHEVVLHTHDMDLFNYAHANNLVLKTTLNDVVLLNDDTLVTEGWLTKLRTASKGFSLTGAHTGPNCSGNPQMWGEGPVILTNYPINMFCAYIPYRVRRAVGLLDEEFVYYGGEDVDYSCRSLMNGFPLVISDAFVIHKDNQSFGKSKDALMKESDKVIEDRYGLKPPFDLSSITPKISIIMATRNRPKLVTEAIKSIEKINYSNYELIIVDDNSSHEVNKVLIEKQEEYGNIILLRSYNNFGLSKARHLGLMASSGQFVFFTDDDDLVLPNRISAPLSCIMTKPFLDVVYCNFNVVDNSGKITPVQGKPFDYQSYLDLEFIIGSGILFGRRNVFIEVPFYSRYDSAVDYDWVFRLLRRGFKIDLCPEKVMNYNRSGSVFNHLSGSPQSRDKHREIYEREMLLKRFKLKR